MASQHALAKEVSFAIQPQQQYAFHLRLTPQLLDSLIKSQEHAEPVSIQFGAAPCENAITVGDTHFGFSAVSEPVTCDLLRIPAGANGGGGRDNGGASASVVAQVKQKILVQRNMVDEKGRVRARAEEAERERKERKTMVLSDKPVPGKGGAPKTERHVRSVTPPPRGPTPPPRPVSRPPLTQSMLAPQQPQQRPPLPPTAAAAGAGGAAGGWLTPTPTPEAASGAAGGSGPGSAAANPGGKPSLGMKKSASAGKLGPGGKHGSSASLATGGSAGAVRASSTVVAAAAKGDLRLALIAMLAERPITMQGVRTVLADVASRLRGFKVPAEKAALERALKKVAEFKAPGKYFLWEGLQKELESAGLGAGDGASGREASPPSSDDSPGGLPMGGARPKAGAKGQQQQGGQARPASAAGQAGGGSGGKRSREPTPEPPPALAVHKAQKTAAHKGAAAGAGAPPVAKAKRSTSQPALGAAAAAAAVHAAPVATPPVASPASRDTPPSLATTTTTSTSSDEAGAGAGAAPGAAAPVPKRARQAGAGAGAPAPRVSPRGGPVRSSSSRGSQEYDDSWVEEHASRQPEAAGSIATKEEYRVREAAFGRKYEVYFRLHQLIEANRKDFQALRDAMEAAASLEERQRHQAEIDKLWRKRGERAKRWDAAFQVLHAELAEAKQRMREFVEAFQQAREQEAGQQQQPQQRGQQQSSGTQRAGAAPVAVQ